MSSKMVTLVYIDSGGGWFDGVYGGDTVKFDGERVSIREWWGKFGGDTNCDAGVEITMCKKKVHPLGARCLAKW